jgi:hypothetical protein
VVIQTSQAPVRFALLPDSGAKTLQTGWQDLPAVQQMLSEAGFRAAYVAHLALPEAGTGQIVSRATLFADPAGAAKAVDTFAKIQAIVAQVQPAPAVGIGDNGWTVQAEVNGFALYAFYWTNGNVLLDVLLQGRQTNVSIEQARALVDSMNANLKQVVVGSGAVPADAITPIPSAQQTLQPSLTVGPIDALFNPSKFSTGYGVTIKSPSDQTVTVTWAGPNCGEWDARPQTITGQYMTISMVWQHPHPPCGATTNHSDVTVTLTITYPGGTLVCSYVGSETGTGPPCSKP